MIDDESAFPQQTGIGGSGRMMGGLTKREYFAAMALQGFCSHDPNEGVMLYKRRPIADLAVERADDLIRALKMGEK